MRTTLDPDPFPYIRGRRYANISDRIFFRARRREQGYLYRSKGHSEISSLTARISSSVFSRQKTPLHVNILRSQRGYRVDPTNCLQKRCLRTSMTQNTPHSLSTTDVASHPSQSLRDHTGLACSTTQHLAALRKHNPRRQVVAVLDTVIVACLVLARCKPHVFNDLGIVCPYLLAQTTCLPCRY